LVFLDEAIPVAGSIRAHGKEILGWDESGLEIPRALHEVRFTIVGLVKNVSHCLGIGSFSKDDQRPLSGDVPVFITPGEVPDFHNGVKRLLQMELVGMVAGVGKNTYFHGVLQILDLIWVSASLDVPKVPGHGTFLDAECIIKRPVKHDSDHQPQRGLASPGADLVHEDSKLRELGREINNASNR